MAKLYFKVASDWEEVVRLRNEIARLKQELKNMDSTQSPTAFKTLNTQLAASTQRMDELVTEAAKAGAVIEGDFKRKIFDASQNVNGLSEKITFQRGAIQKLKNELSGLKEKYREVLKQDGNTSSLEAKIKSTSAKLRDQKDALFNLTQEQANARLSVKKLRDEYELYKNDGKQVVETNKNIGLSLGKALGIIGGVAALKQLGSEIIRVRGEFQSMQTAIETMVGKDMAGQLIPQIKELAKISPLTMSDMVGAEKMMLGFNIQAEDTIKYLKAISDISMGESGKFNSLTLAFSQMSAAGKLMGQDLNQMINAGFNPLQVIAEKTGKSIATLKEEMSKGAVSAEMVQQAFIDATSAGGKFYGMSENASKTINGQISMMQDAMDAAFNEIGQKSEGFLMGMIQGTTKLIQNYEKVGKVLVGLIVTLGMYKTALLVTDVLNNNIIAHKRLSAVIGVTTKAVKGLNAAMKANPYIALASVVIGVGSAIYAFSEKTNKASKANAELTANIQQETKGLDDLFKKLKNAKFGTDDRKKAIDQINSKYPTYLGNLLTEKSTVEEIATAYEEAKKKIIEYNLEKSRDKYLLEPLEGFSDATKDFYVSLDAFLGKLDNDTQRGKFKVYVDQLVESVKDGDYFSMDKIENAFRAAQAKGNYKNTGEWLDAFRAGKEEYGENILRKIGGWDYGNLKGAGQRLEAYSKSLRKAQKEFDEFAKSYTETSKPDPVKSSTYAKDLATAKKEWEDAKKELSVIEKDKDKFTTKQYEDAKKKNETTEKRYKDLGGVTGSALTKQESEAEKQKKEHGRQRLENDRRLIDQADELEQQRINLLADGAEKERAQRELDHKKALQQIYRQQEDLIQKQIDNAQKLYNNNPKNKKGTFYQSQEYKNAGILTKSDQDYFLKKEANENTRYAIAPLLEIQQKYADERLQIEEKFNKDIAALRKAREEAEKDGEANRVLKIDSLINKAITEKGKSLLSYDLKKFKASPEYVKAFENLGNVSEETLKHLLAKLEEYKQKAAETLDPVELREYTSTLEEIQEEINNRDIFGTLAKQKKEVTAAYKALIQAENELNKSRGTESEEEALENYRKAKDRLIKANNEYAKSESEAIAKTEELISAIRGIGDVVGGEAGKVIDLISNIASFALTSMEGVKTASSGASKAVQAVEKASVILGIIGAAIQLIQQLNSLLPDQYSKYEKYAEKVSEINKMRDAVNEYKLAILEAQHAEDRWFAEDRLQDLKNFREVNKEVTEAYFDKLFESQAIYQNKSGGGWLTKIAHYTNPATWLKKIGLPDWLSKTLSLVGSSMFGLEGLLGQLGIMGIEMASNDSYKYDKNQVAAIANLRIETRKAKKGFLGTGIGGKSQKTDDLVSWVKNNLGKDLFDKDGMIDEVLAKDILEKYGDKLVGKTQETLKTLVDLKEKYNEFQEQLQEYVSSLYEPLVDNMVNSLWDWLDGGKSALNSFKDYASNTFRDIVSDMLRTIVLKDVIGDYKEKVLGLYKQYSASEIKEEELMKQIAAFSGELSNKFQDQAPVLQGMLEKINEAFKQQGIDLSDKQDVAQTATKRGVETITQDQAGELTGRITDVQGTTRDIKEQAIQQTETLSILNLKADALLNTNNSIRNIADETRTILANSYLELRQISENTGAIVVPIREMNDKLEKIQRNTENL